MTSPPGATMTASPLEGAELGGGDVIGAGGVVVAADWSLGTSGTRPKESQEQLGTLGGAAAPMVTSSGRGIGGLSLPGGVATGGTAVVASPGASVMCPKASPVPLVAPGSSVPSMAASLPLAGSTLSLPGGVATGGTAVVASPGASLRCPTLSPGPPVAPGSPVTSIPTSPLAPARTLSPPGDVVTNVTTVVASPGLSLRCPKASPGPPVTPGWAVTSTATSPWGDIGSLSPPAVAVTGATTVVASPGASLRCPKASPVPLVTPGSPVTSIPTSPWAPTSTLSPSWDAGTGATAVVASPGASFRCPKAPPGPLVALGSPVPSTAASPPVSPEHLGGPRGGPQVPPSLSQYDPSAIPEPSQ
ncbi:uncharacterized protein VK521_015377 [Ammospiza maritima maritima]